MNVLFILIVVTHVNAGSVVSFQEWSTRAKCEEAKIWTLEKANALGTAVTATCQEK
jgi:hypothetical protein